MTRIELTEKEAGILIELLESSLSDLKTERVGTDNRAWRSQFMEREEFVRDLLSRLGKKSES